jgi:hypothetical protein
MNEQDRANRGFRAQAAWDEFVGPMIGELRDEYTARLVDVANVELSPSARADKITALSNALKIVNTLEGGLQAIIRDGEMAKRDLLRADKIEGMTAPARRLLGIAPIR